MRQKVVMQQVERRRGLDFFHRVTHGEAAAERCERRGQEGIPAQLTTDVAAFNRRMRKTARPVVWEG